MKLLAGKSYDPAAAVSKTAGSLLAVTALDTTNLRLTFTAPSNGFVMVRIKSIQHAASSTAQILHAVLDGATVKARQAPITSVFKSGSATDQYFQTSSMIIAVTAGTSYTWDASYAVQAVGGNIRYGGPDDSTTNNAFGGLAFEVWDTPGLLASIAYDPSTADQSKSAASLVAMTALDTTNLRLTFTAPSSGIVFVRLRSIHTGGTVIAQGTLLGVLDGATVRFRQGGIGMRAQIGTAAGTDHVVREAQGLVTGLTGGTSYTWDAAYGIEIVQTSGNMSWGGPNNNSGNNAWGQFAFDVWNVDTLPIAVGGYA